MKRTIPFLVLIMWVAEGALAQVQPKMTGRFAEARGQYKQIAAFSPKPASGQKAIDTLRFPYDPAVGERRLSLKPVYLSDFSLKAKEKLN